MNQVSKFITGSGNVASTRLLSHLENLEVDVTANERSLAMRIYPSQRVSASANRTPAGFPAGVAPPGTTPLVIRDQHNMGNKKIR